MTPLFARAGELAVFLLIAACASPPFNYAQDRCQGGHNQCQAQCASLNDGPARSACQQRCLSVEDRCYISGEPAAGSTLAEESLIRRARTQEPPPDPPRGGRRLEPLPEPPAAVEPAPAPAPALREAA